MKARLLLGLLFAFLLQPGSLSTDVHVKLRGSATGLQLSWQPQAPGLAAPAELWVEGSDDLVHWRPHSRHILPTGLDQPWATAVPGASAKAFYRVRSQFDVNLVREDAAETLGFGDAFKARLKEIGPISTAEFAEMFPEPEYLPGIDWDPTTATFFSGFNSAPPLYQRDFRLNAAEMALFKTNGFVVSSRITQTNFTDLYYEIFVRDLPVFVSADSVLHAWFKSFEAMLEYLEELYLAPALREVLQGMHDQLPALQAELGQGPLQNSLLDADLHLSVARALGGDPAPSKLGQTAEVERLLNLAAKEEAVQISIFGRQPRLFDFSQLKLRSHYTRSLTLSNYFRSMMWCGRVDLRIAGNPEESSPRELGAALVLNEAMQRSGKLPLWSAMDATIQRFIGAKDSMDFVQMEQIVSLASLASLADIKSLDDLARIKDAIEQGRFGIQEILSDAYFSPFGSGQLWLPRSFAVMGQRFTFDAWALGKVVFDQILWEGRKVLRRRAGALDTAFAVLQNNAAAPEIIARIEDQNGQPFRDGLPYQHNLAAARAVIDSQVESAWHSSMYGEWLSTLRALSEPTTDTRFPASMRTRAWALRRMNTQLASWTQLRHASVLYVKQTYVPNLVCFYPAGFVEPNPQFWGALQNMAESTRVHIEQLPLQGTNRWQARLPDFAFPIITTLDVGQIKTGQVQFLTRFATNIATLKALAEKQLRQEPFTTNETTWLLDLVEIQLSYGQKRYTGWYPRMYYGAQEGLDEFTKSMLPIIPLQGPNYDIPEFVPDFRKSIPIVTDVLTAPPDVWAGDPGAVVHQGVGNVHFMLVAVDNGPDRMVYGGPVFSHYEFDVPGVKRLNDAEWQRMLDLGNAPAAPDWTRSWLAPAN